jgi:hypothetical protein
MEEVVARTRAIAVLIGAALLTVATACGDRKDVEVVGMIRECSSTPRRWRPIRTWVWEALWSTAPPTSVCT